MSRIAGVFSESPAKATRNAMARGSSAVERLRGFGHPRAALEMPERPTDHACRAPGPSELGGAGRGVEAERPVEASSPVLYR